MILLTLTFESSMTLKLFAVEFLEMFWFTFLLEIVFYLSCSLQDFVKVVSLCWPLCASMGQVRLPEFTNEGEQCRESVLRASKLL